MPSKRGFACVSPELRREIASRGGRTAHELGLAHKWTHAEAVAAGRKGAAKRLANKKAQQAAAQAPPAEQPGPQSP